MGFLGYGLASVAVLCLLTGLLSIKSSRWKAHKCCTKVHRPAAIPDLAPRSTESHRKKAASLPVAISTLAPGSTESHGVEASSSPVAISNPASGSTESIEVETSSSRFAILNDAPGSTESPGREAASLAVCGKKIDKATLSEHEKQQILNYHNWIRSRVAKKSETGGNPGPQPGSKYLKDLIWDDALATAAQGWANQCQISIGREFVNEDTKFGQNFFIIRNDLYTELETMLYYWYSEVHNFNNTLVSSYEDPLPTEESYSNYTQMVWGSTTRVGCGIVRFITDENLKQTYFVCNYAPRGNIVGQPVYKTH
ncbi:venom allergen 5-like [Venturia canescens]|uniref:venom allergen 5-like n=1 Tax=Venturia canescens TaxID=32260 RepID=UPI001C9C3774|nr:venom allergen 5-like [Venturia canescens]